MIYISYITNIAIIFGIFFIAKIINILIKKTLHKFAVKEHWHVEAIRPFQVYVSVFVYVMALIVIAAQLNVGEWFQSLLISAGVGAAIIGFAAKDTVANMLAGLLILVDKPFTIGDRIEIGGYLGTIEDITLRYTRVKTLDNKLITIPNSRLSNDLVINYSARERKAIIPVGISYEADIKKAREVLKEIAIDNHLITKEPEVLVRGFGDSSIKLELRVWIEDPFKELQIISEVTEEIKNRFETHGIEIPYPHRVLMKERVKKGKSR